MGTTSRAAEAVRIILITFCLALSSTTVGGVANANQRGGNGGQDSGYAQHYQNYILKGISVEDEFQINDTKTTPFGPAWADIWLKAENFLTCNPPQEKEFSYALCYYSGPEQATGLAADNPPLPCKLSPDGKIANCKCFKLSTTFVPPQVPYLVDINSILNLEVYERTVETCGKDGSDCSPSTGIAAPVCTAINANALIPGADLVSVWSPVKKLDYFAGSTNCRGDGSVYAGCMTAPCYDSGETDANGAPIVDCSCPIFEGPFEIGQGPGPNGQTLDCDLGPANVWSAAHNPKENNPIDPTPPAGRCTPDAPPEAGCPLFSESTDAVLDPSGTVCQAVCEAYDAPSSCGTQLAYTCDSTLCTSLGLGQQLPLTATSIERLGLAKQACNGIQSLDGLTLIDQVETLAGCSCCASQLCGCADNGGINAQTNSEISALNRAQEAIGITPQCVINGTLCGSK